MDLRESLDLYDFKKVLLPIPPLSEQTGIANFLDKKCSKIDRAVAQKEKLLALLKERKQIVIQNAVTKGLNPIAKMKDSGVEWIGEIPENWEIVKIRRVLTKLEQGDSPTISNKETGSYVIKLSAIKGGRYYPEEIKPVEDQLILR